MGKIKVMNEILANQIAAGEVVEKCMNVVKELVENSIDAKSDEIRIDLEDSGVKMIRVQDNGVGMDREDAMLAFCRHATSKLLSEDDLFHIESLGFRGEALPSIASVSNLVLKTCNKEEGWEVIVNAGVVDEVKPADLHPGTTITVRNLFYNTPVRLKYLKNLYTELSYTLDYVNKMALSYPNIRFTLTNNDKVLLQTDGSGNLLKVIHSIYGLAIAKKMIAIEGENDDYAVHGYISYPEVVKGTRNSITTLVNGRIIRNNELNKTIVDTYHTYIAADKYPIIVLAIEVDPSLIDINIHPTKMDIKFSKIESLKELVRSLIQEQLTKLTLIPEIKTEEIFTKEEENRLFESYWKEKQKEEVQTAERVPVPYEKESFSFEYHVEDEDAPYEEEKSTQEFPEKASTPRIKKMFPVGLVHGTYIVAENEDGMYVIDQHAANERINYEKFLVELGSHERHQMDLLFPITIELPANEFVLLKQHFSILDSLGFGFEEFGLNTLIIRCVPAWLPQTSLEDSIRKIIDIIVVTEDFDSYKFSEKIAITLACKKSIKANDHIEFKDMEVLLERLRNCENPFTCPHGRPTIITYSNYELEKLFKRAAD